MFKNMKIGTKIAALAVILIFLGTFAALTGYIGLSNVVNRVEKADDVNRLVKGIMAARQQEKNFIIRGDNHILIKYPNRSKQLKSRPLKPGSSLIRKSIKIRWIRW